MARQSSAETPTSEESSHVVLGRVLGPFGVRGWIRVKPLGRDAGSLLQQPVWGLRRGKAQSELRIEEVKEHGGSVLAKVAGVDDREQADALRGADVTVPRDVLPAAAPGEFYWTDLVGLVVKNEQGILLGKVAGLIEAPAHDVLRVAVEDETDREQLIPFVEPIVRAVDVEGGSIIVDWQKDY